MYEVFYIVFGREKKERFKYFTDALSFAEMLNDSKVSFVEILEDEKQILKFEN